MQPTSVASLGRDQPGTELEGRSKNRETLTPETEMRASRATGHAFLLLHKCFQAEVPNPWALPPSSGWDAWAPGDYELAPLPRGRNFSSAPCGAAGPARPAGIRSPSARLLGAAGTPRKTGLQAAPLHPHGSRDLGPGPPVRPDSPRAPAGQEATGRGAARRSPAQEEGCPRRPPQRRRWRRPCCRAAAAAPSRNSAPLPAPRLLPPKCGTSRKKVRLQLRNSKRSAAAPAPNGVSSPLRCQQRPPGARPAVRGGRARSGKGPAAAERAPGGLPWPQEHAQLAGARGSKLRRVEGLGRRGWGGGAVGLT